MGFTSRRKWLYGWVIISIQISTVLYIILGKHGHFTNSRHAEQEDFLKQCLKRTLSNDPNTRNKEEINILQCKEVTHLVYVRAPKTGSRTMATILNDFGAVRNLTFALPKGAVHFPKDPIMKHDILPITDGKHYDLLVNHATYNRDTIREVFPKDTRIFASIRDPFSQFISGFYYYEAYKRRMPNEIRYSTNSTLHMEWIINKNYEIRNDMFHPFRDPEISLMPLRFGITHKHMMNVTWIRKYIDSVLDQDLDFVMLQEYFDESLVLLKRYFCWQLSDIIYISQHVNRKYRTDHVYTDELLQKYRKIAVAGYMLYDHFYAKFWMAIWKEGPTFFDEVRVFKGILNRISSFCERMPKGKESLLVPGSRWHSPFTVTAKRCTSLQIEIPDFTAQQKKRQMNEISNKSKITH